MRSILWYVLTVVILTSVPVLGDEPTLGWLGSTAAAAPGYTLFAPASGTTTYLIDNWGREVHSWTSAHRPGNSVYLLEDGTLLRTGKVLGPPPDISAGGWGGKFQLFDWDNTLLWEFVYSDDFVQHHHDVEMLPNGNVLVLAWELKTAAEAIAAGRNPALLTQGELWPEHLIEVTSSGDIVWEWHLWDHLIQDFNPTASNFGIVGDHPELLDINAAQGGGADWIHANSIDYNADLDQIVISAHHLDEIWIIDHSTTSAEAASHAGGNSGMGGDLIYRWGNPQNYDAGTTADQTLFGQHCVEWVPEGYPGAGNLTIFNNGVDRPGGNYTSIDEIATPVSGFNYTLTAGEAYGPEALVWTYAADTPTDFFASFISGTRRLPNGNTIICSGPTGYLFEVDTDGNTVWEYRVPTGTGGSIRTQGDSPGSNSCFRTQRYAPGYPGLAGRDLTPGDPIEFYPSFGDFDDDGNVDLADFTCFEQAMTGACDPCVEPIYVDSMAFFADFDGVGDVDCEDYDAFASAWTSGATVPDLPACSTQFIRGDASNDLTVDIADAVSILDHLFSAGALACHLAADANDDETLDIGDPVYVLSALFSGGPDMPAPTGSCGVDPTVGLLTCDTPACP